MIRSNVQYKNSQGDQDHPNYFFPNVEQRNIRNLKYGTITLSRVFYPLREPAVIFIPVGFFLQKNNTINKIDQ